jgi:hypothetical protein
MGALKKSQATPSHQRFRFGRREAWISTEVDYDGDESDGHANEEHRRKEIDGEKTPSDPPWKNNDSFRCHPPPLPPGHRRFHLGIYGLIRFWMLIAPTTRLKSESLPPS